MSHKRHFVLKICETIRTGIRCNYSNTRILFGVPKNLNTKYQILFGIEKILIPNMNTTNRSNYPNSIQIPNYSSQPETIQGSPNAMITDPPCASSTILHYSIFSILTILLISIWQELVLSPYSKFFLLNGSKAMLLLLY